jgi:polyisoprenoid-binding protein YceI
MGASKKEHQMSTATKTTRIQTEESPMPPARPRTAWAIDPVHSFVEFGVKHMMIATVRGRFTDITGLIVLDDLDPTGSTVSVEIAAGSLDTQDGQRDAHLRSPDFLDVDRSPTIRFVSTRVERGTQDSLRVVGDLTIRRTTRPVVLDALLTGRTMASEGIEAIGYTAETTINRRDFGLTWNALLETGGVVVGDTIQITINGMATKPID